MQRPSGHQFIGALSVGVIVAASCSSSGSDATETDPIPASRDVAVETSTPSTSPLPDAPEPPPSTQSVSATESLPDTAIDRAELADDAELDWGLPSSFPTEPSGALGFSRYVFVRDDVGEIVPVVVEGTRGEQARCQEVERDCSYRELKSLHESGDEVPADLGMSRAELAELVGQLDLTAATVNAMPTPDEACAAGYSPVSAQNPNMGIHFVNPALLADGFDPANPEMLLFASEDAIGIGRSEIGTCGADGWDGIEGLRVTGSAFFIDLTDEHPAGYAGPIDQWHVHYNSCANGEFDSTGSVALCEQNGGVWFDVQPNWMIHSYVADGFDSDTGVFAMWNSSVWPIGGSGAGSPPPTDAVEVAIEQFEFGTATIDVGESVWFSNSDRMPHVVNAGTPAHPLVDFSSPLIGQGDAWQLTVDEPGVVEFYCSLHPSMVGTVIVE